MRSFRLGARWPLALLFVAIGLTIVAGYESIRVGRSNQAAAERVVHDYAEFAAWAYARHLEQTLREMARELLNPINHGGGLHSSPVIPGPNTLVHFISVDNECGCHRPRLGPVPEAFLGFSIRADTLAVAVNTHPRPLEGWEVDRPLAVPVPVDAFIGYTPDDRAAIVQTLRRNIHEMPDNEHGFTWVTMGLSVGPRMIAFALMPTTWGDTLVYGVQYTPRAVNALFRGIMEENPLLPPSIADGVRTHDLIDIEVRDRRNQLMFTSSTPNIARDLVGQSELPDRFAKLAVTAAIPPEQAGKLIVGGLPRSRLPFLLGVLVLAAGLSVTAVTLLRREADLGRVRSEWVASVSHELRTPLAQIRLFLDTVRLGRANTDERREWALSQIDRETTRLNHLIEKVLSFSRLGRGPASITHPLDVGAETDAIVNEFRTIAETRKMTVTTEIESVPGIQMHRDAYRHILLNLLDNAVKYGPAGQTVRVRIARMGEAVMLTVADEGPGVPANERESVWRPFARGTASTEQGGSGIGLSIVRDIATQHGGRAWVATAPTGGALFSVSLPIRERAA